LKTVYPLSCNSINRNLLLLPFPATVSSPVRSIATRLPRGDKRDLGTGASSAGTLVTIDDRQPPLMSKMLSLAKGFEKPLAATSGAA